ncbi:GNAT family N-acetyltransferase [Dactylosporangium fulvum]|uniref:GNAT family N-acetyltransferase n=1 Tax=Dactylosporangium fulvum TaxID=53359 RepID=A0ABY5W238_9ACTN|nr:GNAT family N-acetyltransferase [Dactylosporangium fulvum]UWP84097.1 GNAT family N-acetyltransferase [Dactylosporangium fulvum]
MSEINIRLTRYGSRVVNTLTTAALAELAQRYGGEGDSTPILPGEFDPPEGGFLVAYDPDHEPIGCAGWRTLAEEEDAAELKRMYVVPAHRGRGVAKALLVAVENDARQAGRRRMWLETGTAQPEAIALYERSGYLRIEDFGHYKGYEGVRSFGKDL